MLSKIQFLIFFSISFLGEEGSAEDAIAKAKKEGDAGDAENVDYYSIAHTVSESISEQASILGKSYF